MERRYTPAVIQRTARLACLALSIGTLPVTFADERAGKGTAPALWSVSPIHDLSRMRDRSQPWLREPSRAGLAFVDGESLVVYEVYPGPGPLSSRDNPDESRYRLRVYMMSAASGESRCQREWGTRRRDSELHVAFGGILVRTGNVLRVCSTHLQETRRVELSKLYPQEDAIIRMWVSASRRTVLLNYYSQGPLGAIASHFLLLDGGTFEQKKSWDEDPPLRRVNSISDTMLAVGSRDGVMLSVFGSNTWRRVPAASGSPTLVTDKLLVTQGRDVAISYAGGQAVVSNDAERNHFVDSLPTVAQSGVSFAVGVQRLRGERMARVFDVDAPVAGGTIEVYSVALKRCVLTVPVLLLPKSDYDFALSPDGSKLAVLNDRSVSLYAVPIQ